MSSYLFDRPIIILAAPRSGSTFLFEMLSQSSDLYTIGGESHAVIEGMQKFNMASGFLDSNKISADDLDNQSMLEMQSRFFSQLRNSKGETFTPGGGDAQTKPRFLEKTPKNSLRFGMLEKLFPDALYVYLYRDPKENISSIIDAWNSGRFITYPNLPGRHKPWSLLLPESWRTQHDNAIEETAAYQWKESNNSIIDGLLSLPPTRWTAVSYFDLKSNPKKALEAICRFCDITFSGINIESNKEKLSVHTLTPPKANKWHKNAKALNKVLPSILPTVNRIKDLFPHFNPEGFSIKVDEELLATDISKVTGDGGRIAEDKIQPKNNDKLNIGRNDLCYCHSGKRFKHCHGGLK